MSNSTITCSYEAVAFTTNVSFLQTAMVAVPIDWLLPTTWGLYLKSDSTVLLGQNVTRTLQLSMVPSAAATAVANLQASSGTVGSVTVSSPGAKYQKPPVVSFTGGGAQIAATGYAQMELAGSNILKGGSGYSSPVAVLSGGQLAPGGVPGAVTLGVTGGAITSVNIITPGGPYVTPPLVTVQDPFGSGAEIVLGLGVSGVVVTLSGFGYTSPPNVVFTPLFKQMVPDTSSQVSIMRGWMKKIFEEALDTPIIESDPAVS